MKFLSSKKTKYLFLSKRLLTWTSVFVITAIFFFTYSETAHAGLFSYMNTLFGSQQVSAKVTQKDKKDLNSQNIPLLQAPSNINPNPDKAMGGVSPVIANTLVADIALSDSVSGTDNINTQISLYVVREGDNLSSIAKMFGVSVNTIVWANNINRTTPFSPGQTLVILPVTGINVTVKKGDTIQGIVQKYKADIDEVLQYNDININSKLSIGQTIIIPDVELQITPPIQKYVKGYVRNNRAHDTNGPDLGSYFMRPCDEGLCRKSQDLHGYNGKDFAGPVGTPIYASAEGTVIVSRTSGWNGGYGIYVIISHDNGTQTVYGHNSKNIVTAGERVKKGQHIANIGNTGNSTGPHVHFEIRGAKNTF